MGRKAIGHRAMTAAERKRRQRGKLVTKPVTKPEPVTEPAPVTKPDEPSAELIEVRAKIERLQTEVALARLVIATLKAENASLTAKAAKAARPRAPPKTPDERLTAANKRIKGLKETFYRSIMDGGTFGKLSKALRDDYLEPLSEAEQAKARYEALQALNGWRTRTKNLNF